MDRPTALSPHDLAHLRRCIELVREALADGDEPFGSVLVDAAGTVLHEDRNRTAGGDQTRHPELGAAAHVPAEVRPTCTVSTSGEHCPMCAAGHAWVGLGRMVYAGSVGQLTEWRRGRGLPPSPVAALPITGSRVSAAHREVTPQAPLMRVGVGRMLRERVGGSEVRQAAESGTSECTLSTSPSGGAGRGRRMG